MVEVLNNSISVFLGGSSTLDISGADLGFTESFIDGVVDFISEEG